MMNCVLAAGLFFSAHAAPSAAAGIRPAAEVSASSGPVRLILRVHRTKIKAGEKLWHQIGVQNVGKAPLTVSNPIFFDPETMESRYLDSYGIRVEIIRPDGQPLGQTSARFRYREPDEPGVSGLLEVDTPELKQKVAEWRSQGLSQHEINLRLIKHHDEKRREQVAKRPHGRKLKPRETIWTGSWFYHNEKEKRRGTPPEGPIGDFAELDYYDLNEPGTYRIRATYDYVRSHEERAKLSAFGLSTEGMLRVATHWVRVHVERER